MERNYWLTTHKDSSWQEFHRLTNAQLASFPNTNWNLVKKIQVGDYILCYQAGTSTWVGLLEVVAEPFYIDEEPLNDKDRIWDNPELEFRCRVPVRALLDLPSDDGVPIAQLMDQLTFYPGPTPNYWKGFLSDNPRRLRASDGEIIQQALQEKVAKRHTSLDKEC